jgi:nitrate reductase delta subunit
MTRTLRALSTLLSYPTAMLQQSLGDISEVLESDPTIPAHVRVRLHALLMELVSGNLFDLQGRYILLFDCTRSLSLHLLEHTRDESGDDRGQVMTDLKQMSDARRLPIGPAEMPDYLPSFLEFLVTLPASEAHQLLRRLAHIFAALADRLHNCQSAYEAVFQALVALAAAQPATWLPPLSTMPSLAPPGPQA